MAAIFDACFGRSDLRGVERVRAEGAAARRVHTDPALARALHGNSGEEEAWHDLYGLSVYNGAVVVARPARVPIRSPFSTVIRF